ncbi:MAG: radical SAM protein [Candidatus Moraniibacteriota bacterium]|nr:MAG: radical SAM protein [Candidatus Moranbacteria bacterium]
MKEIVAKKIITKSKLPKVDFCFNPYIGCTHSCVYCYARFMGRFTGHASDQWGTYLDCKINAPELLQKELPTVKRKKGVVIIGSVTDCYQPAEKVLRITRKCLEEFLNYQISISVLTKNKLAERDFDLFRQFNNCELGVSVSILDQSIQKILEPNTSTPNERITLLKKAKESGIKTYVFLGPIHPFLSDVKAILTEVLPYTDFVMAEIPNLRCGNWKSLTDALKKIDQNFDCTQYKKIAESKEFYISNKILIEGICRESKVEFRGIFEH